MKQNSNTTQSRKEFLKRSALAGVMGLGATSVLGYCGRRPEEEGGEETSSAATTGACEDVSALSAAEKQQRDTMVKNLKYVPKTADAAKRCDGCVLYTQPAGGSACGGCQLFPGPVAPEGYCISWQAKAG
ncbi:MAG: high-potential iron-sulfur protein [bacterium]|nr:high-potential iron-sulfur protein [bacterium]